MAPAGDTTEFCQPDSCHATDMTSAGSRLFATDHFLNDGMSASRDGDACQDQRRPGRSASGESQQEPNADRRPQQPAGQQYRWELCRQPPVESDDGPKARAPGNAQQTGVCQRIAERALQHCPRQA